MSKPTKEDPTGRRGNRRKTNAKFRRRLSSGYKSINDIFRAIPFTSHVDRDIKANSLTLYQYQVTDPDALRAAFELSMDDALQTVFDRVPGDWWFAAEIELPWRSGAIDVAIDVSTQTAAEDGLFIGVENVLFSASYAAGLRTAVANNYGLIKSLSSESAKEAYLLINNAMQAGKSPTAITGIIRDRFKNSTFKARRIVATEVNRAYNDARINSIIELNNQNPEITIKLMHISALLSVSRQGHIFRHRKIFSTTEQLLWWNSGTERINCLCSTRAVVLDSDNNIIDQELQKRALT